VSQINPRLDQVHVLVVDDDEDTVDVLRQVLMHLGAIVITTASSPEALTVLAQKRVDVIVSDLSMPAMDGLEFMRRVRALPGQANFPTPAIAFTGFARDEDRERAEESGYQSFIPKPADPFMVASEIARLVRSRTPWS
jgi:CheY-like chemotaxis protein